MMVLKTLFIIVWKVAELLVIPKKHYKGFEEATVDVEDHLPFISGLDAYIIETPVDVQFCEIPGSM